MSQTVLLRPTATGRGEGVTTRPPKPTRRLLCVGIRLGGVWTVRTEDGLAYTIRQRRTPPRLRSLRRLETAMGVPSGTLVAAGADQQKDVLAGEEA